MSAGPPGAVDGPSVPRLLIVDGVAERGIQLVSRWAGILVFAAALLGIGVLTF
ncbi:hypothetical protein ACVWZA_002746 [Sphingomonas sp. UYAg733]